MPLVRGLASGRWSVPRPTANTDPLEQFPKAIEDWSIGWLIKMQLWVGITDNKLLKLAAHLLTTINQRVWLTSLQVWCMAVQIGNWAPSCLHHQSTVSRCANVQRTLQGTAKFKGELSTPRIGRPCHLYKGHSFVLSKTEVWQWTIPDLHEHCQKTTNKFCQLVLVMSPMPWPVVPRQDFQASRSTKQL